MGAGMCIYGDRKDEMRFKGSGQSGGNGSHPVLPSAEHMAAVARARSKPNEAEARQKDTLTAQGQYAGICANLGRPPDMKYKTWTLEQAKAEIAKLKASTGPLY